MISRKDSHDTNPEGYLGYLEREPPPKNLPPLTGRELLKNLAIIPFLPFLLILWGIAALQSKREQRHDPDGYKERNMVHPLMYILLNYKLTSTNRELEHLFYCLRTDMGGEYTWTFRPVTSIVQLIEFLQGLEAGQPANLDLQDANMGFSYDGKLVRFDSVSGSEDVSLDLLLRELETMFEVYREQYPDSFAALGARYKAKFNPNTRLFDPPPS